MSLARHIFRELRPLVNMLEDPLARSSSFYGLPSRSVFDHPFFHSPETFRPALDLTEEGNSYILEADLPGVKRENLEVRVGEGGRSVTIEGKILSRRNGESAAESKAERGTGETRTPSESSSNADASADRTPSQITVERPFTGSSTFTRTVWLPHPVDSNNVVAKLSDGILHITIPKAEDKASVKIRVD